MMPTQSLNTLSNRPEYEGFWGNALAWHGSVTPRVLAQVILWACYGAICYHISKVYPRFVLEIAPFEWSGAVLGLLLVVRTNAGYDRWWEARKLWGGIVNQCRNLAISAAAFGAKDPHWVREILGWTASFPHATRRCLRSEKELGEVSRLVGAAEAARIEAGGHYANAIVLRISELLADAKNRGLIDGFIFQHLDMQKTQLIDHMGACERILRTPIPFVIALKVRRFVALFLLLLPFGLAEHLGVVSTPMVTGLVAYALLSLDRIGYELQNPFAQDRLSHLPLDDVCATIEKNVTALMPQEGQVVRSPVARA